MSTMLTRSSAYDCPRSVRQFRKSLQAMDDTFGVIVMAVPSHPTDEPRRDKDIHETLDHVLAALHQRKTELAQLAVSEPTNQLHLVLQAGLTMATRGVLLMQSALQQRDDRAAALGAEQYIEGMKDMTQRAELQSA